MSALQVAFCAVVLGFLRSTFVSVRISGRIQSSAGSLAHEHAPALQRLGETWAGLNVLGGSVGEWREHPDRPEKAATAQAAARDLGRLTRQLMRAERSEPALEKSSRRSRRRWTRP